MQEDKFTYSYSPAKYSEVDKIAAKYAAPGRTPDSDLERLRKLDRRAELPGTIAGIAAGLTGIAVLVCGILLVLRSDSLIAGLIVGSIGFALAAAATPISKAVTQQSRLRYRDEILALTQKIKSEH